MTGVTFGLCAIAMAIGIGTIVNELRRIADALEDWNDTEGSDDE